MIAPDALDRRRADLTEYQRIILAIIASESDGGATAKEIAQIYSPTYTKTHARSSVGSVRGIAIELVKRGLADKLLRKRELFAYRVTAAGRKALQEAAE